MPSLLHSSAMAPSCGTWIASVSGPTKNVGTTASAPLRSASSTPANTSCSVSSPGDRPLHPARTAGDRLGGERGQAAAHEERVYPGSGQAGDQLLGALQFAVDRFLHAVIHGQDHRGVAVRVEQPAEPEGLTHAGGHASP